MLHEGAGPTGMPGGTNTGAAPPRRLAPTAGMSEGTNTGAAPPTAGAGAACAGAVPPPAGAGAACCTANPCGAAGCGAPGGGHCGAGGSSSHRPEGLWTWTLWACAVGADAGGPKPGRGCGRFRADVVVAVPPTAGALLLAPLLAPPPKPGATPPSAATTANGSLGFQQLCMRRLYLEGKHWFVLSIVLTSQGNFEQVRILLHKWQQTILLARDL